MVEVSLKHLFWDSGAIPTVRTRNEACADDDRRYAPQDVHILRVSRNVLTEGAAGRRLKGCALRRERDVTLLKRPGDPHQARSRDSKLSVLIMESHGFLLQSTSETSDCRIIYYKVQGRSVKVVESGIDDKQFRCSFEGQSIGAIRAVKRVPVPARACLQCPATRFQSPELKRFPRTCPKTSINQHGMAGQGRATHEECDHEDR